MIKYTPAPWRAQTYPPTDVVTPKGELIAKCGDSVMLDETEKIANHHLIAAAPELLGALKDAYPFVSDDNLRVKIGKIITKAEGL